MITECIFKEGGFVKGDGEIDKEKVFSYMDAKITDADWNPVLKPVFARCQEEIDSKSESLSKFFAAAPFNIDSTKCNTKYLATITCINLESFVVSFLLFKVLKHIMISFTF